MDLSKYKEIFMQECREHLQSMNDALLQFEQDHSNMNLIDTLFRDFHSIKGMAASMGYTPISELSHKLEDLLDKVRNAEITGSTDLVNILFNGLDILDAQVTELETEDAPVTGGEDVLESINSFFEETRLDQVDHSESLPEDLPDVEPDFPSSGSAPVVSEKPETDTGMVEHFFRIRISPETQIPGARVLIVEKKLQKLGTITNFHPPMNEIKAGRFEGVLHIQISSDKSPTRIMESIREVPEIDSIELLPAGEKKAYVSGSSLDDLKKKESPSKTERTGKPGQPDSVTGIRSSKIRVDIKLLDELMNNVGELIINKSRLRAISSKHDDREMLLSLDQLDMLVSDIHTSLMQARMLPFETIANRFPRVVRDLSKRACKDIEFKIIGSEIELDRAILDEIGDPLIHSIRNAIDHGIESPDKRINAGKSPRGKIVLTATREKESVLIEIQDDGAGIDSQAIKTKAVERGLTTREHVELLSPEELFMFICMPGFSTTETVTDISGRGVGMDVVKTKIEALGGSLDISSEIGVGTRIILKLPLTVAIIDVLLTKVGGLIFAIPISKVDRTMEVTRENIIVSRDQKLLETKDGIIPLFRLSNILNISTNGDQQDIYNIVLVEIKRKKLGLIVDDLFGQEEIVIKPLGQPLERIKGFSGVTIMGDGELVLILDVQNLLR